MMRSFRRDHLGRRFDEWQARLQDPSANRRRAVDLYCGNSWSIIRSLCADDKIGKIVRFWIVSAGHGLICLGEMISAYAATFAAREVDTVIPSELADHDVSEWWNLLIKSRRKWGVDVASISDIAKVYPNDPLIAAVSRDYLKAIADDLEVARSKMADTDRFLIIAAGARKTGKLADNFLPCDARLEHHLGGSRMVLNARILQSILMEFSPKDIRVTHLKKHFELLLTSLPKATYPKRQSSDDATVSVFIQKNLMKNNGGAYTSLLQLFRSTGRACEQRRFRGLFKREAAKLKKAA